MKTLLFRLLVLTFLCTAAIEIGSAVAQSSPSAFDGKWHGERIDVSNDFICNVTDISGTVSGGQISFRLHYNDTQLTGQIGPDGSFDLEGDHDRWEYEFSGKAVGDKIAGTWSVGNAPCRGTWWVKRVK
ncbi:MAG TPA: hypothetical protein DCS82_03040 [Rhodospirillaceae bacterium]|nr:hypothetical protein [Rhodospirillaceae bacterium]HAA92626.1 hypothetical protein [Rhodospirillaceae bacterium]HAT34667.1 hypothetical protein [Rhodospirillaceae bacterium]|tara:strand:- start:34 stop:420 length:387 start_codon:yes stop_codon:yes gene_type:complete